MKNNTKFFIFDNQISQINFLSSYAYKYNYHFDYSYFTNPTKRAMALYILCYHYIVVSKGRKLK